MVELTSNHRAYRGHVLGLPQPSVHTVLRFESPPSDADLDAAERCLRACLDEDFPEPDAPLRPGDDAALHLTRRIVQWTAALQRRVHIPVSEASVCRPLASGGRTRDILVALPCTQSALALKTLAWVVGALQRAARHGVTPTEETVERLLDELRPGGERGKNAFHIAEAAYRIGLPVQRPLAGTSRHGALMIGTGCHGRWFLSTITERTSAFGVGIAGDKASTAKILREAGLPGGVHESAATAQQAVAAAARLGYPVVVKPADQDQGRGVAADLRTPAEVATAFEGARKHSRAILVEQHCEGFTHRLTVVDGRLVKVVKRVAGGVVGDGVHDIATLLAIEEKDPRRQRRRRRTGLSALSLDDEARELLSRAGLSADSVPAAGEHIRMRRRDNVNAGGSNLLVPLDAVHPDNRALAIRAAALLRLDIAGVDLIIGDISRSWLEVEALICEVNAQPQMGTSGTPDVYCDLLRDMLPGGARIPVDVAITSAPGEPSAKVLERARRHSEARTIAHAGGLFVDGQRLSRPFRNGYEAAVAALMLPETRSLLFLQSLEEVLRSGLPLDRIDRIGIVTEQRPDADAAALLKRAMALVGPCARSIGHW